MYNITMMDMAANSIIIPLEIAKNLIISALQDFDPQLGRRAKDILYSDRLNVVEEFDPDPDKTMMQCRPAGYTKEDAERLGTDMDEATFRKRFAPHFTEQYNKDGAFAVIDYTYSYTKDSVLYLAHELGHAIADDMQREAGLSFRDFSPNALEEQAYFIQTIVAATIDPAFNEQSRLKDETAQTHIAGAFNRSSQRYNAYSLYEKAGLAASGERSGLILRALGGSVQETQNAENGLAWNIR